MGILTAISVVLIYLIHFPIFPMVPFLEYDPADIPIMLGTFAMGPLNGFIMTVTASVIQGITVSTGGSWYGIVMHIIATGSYVLVAGNIYRVHKTKKTAIISMLLGCAAWTLIMIPANLTITPFYLGGIKARDMAPMLPWIGLFNLLKSLINSLITFLLYKRVSPILHQ